MAGHGHYSRTDVDNLMSTRQAVSCEDLAGRSEPGNSATLLSYGTEYAWPEDLAVGESLATRAPFPISCMQLPLHTAQYSQGRWLFEVQPTSNIGTQQARYALALSYSTPDCWDYLFYKVDGWQLVMESWPSLSPFDEYETCM